MLETNTQMNKIIKKRLFLIAVPKKALYLRRNEYSNGFTGSCNYPHSGHAYVACHREAVQCGFKVRSSAAFLPLVGLLAIAMSILPQDVAAQDGVEGYRSLIPQAPDAQAMARAIDIPVNAYTGIPQISIPLYEIKVGELSIPITLSYHAGGILANQEATEVGLGWSLSAGGAITRTIKCMDDFDAVMGYFSYQQDWDGQFESLYNYFDFSHRTFIRDMEPDIFYYSTPSESGKFFFDHNRNAHMVDKRSNIRTTANVATNRFELVDARGIRYLYEDIEMTYPYTNRGMQKVNTTDGGYDAVFNGMSHIDYQDSDEFVSAWKLTKVITPKGDTITFVYEQEKYQLPVQESAAKYSCPAGANSGTTLDIGSVPNGLAYSSRKNLIDGKRLVEIRWRGGVLQLEAEDREDILPYAADAKPKAIKAIRIEDGQGNLVKRWLFDYGYFNPNPNSQYPHLFKRLKLEAVKDALADSIGYGFTYDESGQLPAKNTRNTDYWGYFNGSTQGKDYVCPVVMDGLLYTGGDKEVSFQHMRLGTLLSMTNMTGGTTSFTFECNKVVTDVGYFEYKDMQTSVMASRSESQWYSEFGPISTDTITVDYRQRVTVSATASNYDDIDIETEYTFQDHIGSPFQLLSLDESGFSSCILNYDMPQSWDETQEFNNDTTLLLNPGKYVIRVESIVEGFVAEMAVGYKKCEIHQAGEERLIGGLRIAHIEGERSIDYDYYEGILFKEPTQFGYETYFYTDSYLLHSVVLFVQHTESVTSLSSIASGQIMGYSEVYEKYEDGSCNRYVYHNEKEEYLVDNYPIAGTQTDWLNGFLVEKEAYDSNNDISEATIFEFEGCLCDTIKGYVYDGGNVFPYQDEVLCVLPNRTTTETHLSNGVRISIERQEYDMRYNCSSETITTGNDSLVTRYFYPYDLEDSVSQQMVGANIIGSPVAQLKSKNGTIFDGAWTRYGLFDGRILPLQELRLNTDQTSTNLTSCRFDTIMEYKNYDKYGNPRWMRYKGTPITCLWGYHGMHPVIEVVGGDFNNVQSVLSSSTVSSLLDANNITTTQLRGWHNTLQGAFHDFSVSACRYIPLIGASEIIGTEGISTTYEYDAAGRLTSKRLHGTDLLQRYAYHYGAENYRTATSMLDANASDSLLTVQYYDQWGRPSLLASQDKRTDRNFSYSLQTYDFLGRPSREWNPFPSGDVSPHSMTESAFASLSASYYTDTLAFSETSYDALGNTVRVTTPGEAWAEEGRQNTFRYLTNGSNEVKRYTITSSDNLGGDSNYYAAGSLLCTEQRDPDGKTVRRYSDIFGNVILERRTDSLDTFDTYYVYDAMNRLRMVLSPKCQDSTDDMVACRYEYRYNGRGLVIWKRLPGCEPVQYWYDRHDQPICMQDGLLRSNGRYRFFIYDRLGRLCIQGTTPMCYQQRHFSFISQTFSGPLFKDTGYRYLGDLSELSPNNCTLELVNYYDGYNYISLNQPISGVAQYASLLGTSNNVAPSRLTGTRQYASNGEAMLTTFAYDDRGRIHKAGEFGLNGILTVTDYHHNFFDGIDSTRTTFLVYTANTPAWTGSILQTNTYYQHTNLPHVTTVTITKNGGNSSTETVMSLQYDAFGNIKNNDRGGTEADMSYTYDLLHGWVKEISSTGGFKQKLYREGNTDNPLFNGSISAMTWKVGDHGAVHRYDYTYDGLNRLTKAAYSQPLISFDDPGLIDSLVFLDPIPGHPTLNFIPVTGGIGDLIQPIDINATDRYTEQIWYDKNSNIEGLMRYGMNNQRQYGLIDSLVITRNGNQLKTIEDYAEKHLTYTGASDFYDGCTYSNEYSYNANGALESDLNRDIDLIQYDDLGNARCIYYFEHDQIEYIYAANGTKLRTIHRPASSSALTDSIDYIGNLILNNGQPSMYLFDGGYATFNQSGAVDGWHYYIQDYMGNNRMVVNKNGTKEQITHYYPYGGVIGDISTNESFQNYKFEGKELDRTFGLDNYDIHARQYFAMAPMWDRVDSKAEDYYYMSPYVYCGGNPVNFRDNNGMWIVGSDDQKVTYDYNTGEWSSNATEDTKIICNEMLKTQVGTELFTSLQDSSFPISFKYEREKYYIDNKGVADVEKIGSFKYETEGNMIKEETTISVYEKAIDDMLWMINGADMTVFPQGTIQERYRSALGMGIVTKEAMIGATGVHEAVHATDSNSNSTGAPKEKREENPVKMEIKYLKQLKGLE